MDTPSHTDSSADRSFPTPSSEPHSNSSASLEIFLGPQPMSYVYRRQNVLGEDFDRSPGRPGLYHNIEKPKHVDITSPEQHHVKTDSKAEDHARPVTLSRWRQEQIRKFKPSRPVSGARERPIPILHGPLSLPYSRNPR